MADEAGEMAELVFDLQYDGPALQTHEMNVRDLAPALVATAELFQEMNRLARPTDPDISVNVRATGEGSFLVELKLFYEATVGLLGSVDATALVNLGTLLHWLGSLISLRKKRAASAITGQDEPDEEGLVRVIFADATELEVPAAVLQFDRNVTIRQNLSEIVKPLGREGVDVVRVQQNELVIGEITEPELPAFLDTQVEPSEREELLVTEGEKWLEIISPVFQRDNKWRLSDGQVTFWALIQDNAFLDRVDRHEEVFGKGDRVRVRFRESQHLDEHGRLVTETDILEVKDHRPAPNQTSLFDGPETS